MGTKDVEREVLQSGAPVEEKVFEQGLRKEKECYKGGKSKTEKNRKDRTQ